MFSGVMSHTVVAILMLLVSFPVTLSPVPGANLCYMGISDRTKPEKFIQLAAHHTDRMDPPQKFTLAYNGYLVKFYICDGQCENTIAVASSIEGRPYASNMAFSLDDQSPPLSSMTLSYSSLEHDRHEIFNALGEGFQLFVVVLAVTHSKHLRFRQYPYSLNWMVSFPSQHDGVPAPIMVLPRSSQSQFPLDFKLDLTVSLPECPQHSCPVEPVVAEFVGYARHHAASDPHTVQRDNKVYVVVPTRFKAFEAKFVFSTGDPNVKVEIVYHGSAGHFQKHLRSGEFELPNVEIITLEHPGLLEKFLHGNNEGPHVIWLEKKTPYICIIPGFKLKMEVVLSQEGAFVVRSVVENMMEHDGPISVSRPASREDLELFNILRTGPVPFFPRHLLETMCTGPAPSEPRAGVHSP
ncbi:hypothetical protein RF11_05768 [Thelohanellus kitauei]|uniref:Uncharacterized protein n=1 Tax=Thelohanellus kitauei TaxID=669202 RepID=A0A0C2JBU9_THEKT|nr:hypothetical protein RF11_05768 [Thelohanellus kitauei]